MQLSQNPCDKWANHTSKTQPRQMSFDFIAPGFNAASPPQPYPPKDETFRTTLHPLMTENIGHQSRTTKPSLPGIWEINLPSPHNHYRTTPYPAIRTSYNTSPHPTHRKPDQTTPPLSPSSSSASSSSRSSSPPLPRRLERHEYDPEERFAVVYLRLNMKINAWKDLEEAFDVMFPPGKARRPSAPPAPQNKALPRTYPKRTIGGLECRYYRIRKDEGMSKVRERRKQGGTRETQALTRMENNLVKLWVEGLSTERRVHMGLVKRTNESVDEWVARARPVYHSHSDFWRAIANYTSGISIVSK